jgi:hypothetical protein
MFLFMISAEHVSADNANAPIKRNGRVAGERDAQGRTDGEKAR